MVREVSAAEYDFFGGAYGFSGVLVAHPAKTATISRMNSRKQFIGNSFKVILPFAQTGKNGYG